MMHKHKVYDTDPYFSINPLTRLIKNETSAKITLIQHDHNSERFTFEIPRFIEEHDMSLCNVVQVHYINIESGNRNQNEDVYGVVDLHIDPDDDDKVVCSWLVSGNATKYVGSLNFVVRFSCVTDGVIEYAWNTAVFSGISVSSGIFNTDIIAEEYSDILAQWTARIEALEQGSSSTAERPTAEWVITDADASAVEGSICTIGKYELPEGVDAGAEIKDILFSNSEGNYISIRNLASEDRIPYIPLFDKIYYDDYAGAYMVGVLGMISSTPNWVMNNVNNYVQMSIKVIYYTD